MWPYSSVQIHAANAIGEFSATGTPLPAILDVYVWASFPGTVQHLTANATDGLLTNASACGWHVTAPDRLAYAPADTATVRSWVRIVNIGDAEAVADVILRDAATSEPAAIWI